ncbi:MAG: hypothetical protein M3R27_09355 [Bacteroidota bacterium]|nr:hypothetical protein [Bacteroidota bacterium]
MKKAAVILLLGIFLFNLGGYFVAFKALEFQAKKEIKAQIKNGIPENEMIRIVINSSNSSELDWIKSDKEFRYKGEMYDIVRIEIKNSGTEYFCIQDKQEKILFANLEDHIRQHISDNKPLKNKTAKELKDHVLKVYSSEIKIALPLPGVSEFHYGFSKIRFQSVALSIFCPPPEKKFRT